MEQNSDVVAMGKFISENTYKRKDHEIQITTDEDDIVLDFYDGKNKIIHEVKKSDKMEDVHIWQVKYYISVLEKKGITGVTGEINYPKLKQKIKVELNAADKIELTRIRDKIKEILNNPLPPAATYKPFCKNCSYYDLCYV